MSSNFDPRDLQYYFEAQERDTLDREGRSRRSSEVLSIRDKLLALPERDFNSVVQTIKSILNPNSTSDETGSAGNKRRDAADLYEKARSSDKPLPLKMGSV